MLVCLRDLPDVVTRRDVVTLEPLDQNAIEWSPHPPPYWHATIHATIHNILADLRGFFTGLSA